MRLLHVTTQDTDTASPFARLPVAVLARILRHLPLRQSLGTAAVVSREWAKAAAHSASQLQLTLKQLSAAAFVSWLQRYGQQVESLQLTCWQCDFGLWRASFLGHPPPQTLQLQLPWAQLQGLQVLMLDHIELPPIAGAATAAVSQVQAVSSSLGAATRFNLKLKQLELRSCTLASPDCLLQLASSTGLTALCVESTRFAAAAEGEAESIVCRLLQRQPHLIVLHLVLDKDAVLSCDVVQHVDKMQQLQDVRLRLSAGEFDSCFLQLPPSLTKLQLTDGRDAVALGAADCSHPLLPPQLQQLSRLECLVLRHCRLPSQMLVSLSSQLRRLELNRCTLLPGDASEHMSRPRWTPLAQTLAGIAAFLSSLQHLTQLKHLQLQDMTLRQATEWDEEVPPLEQFSALTASTNLTALHLVYQPESHVVPADAMQFVFPAGRQLPQLREVSIDCFPDWSGHCMDGDDLARLISACSNLAALNIRGAMYEDADISPLLQLPQSCSNLIVGGYQAFDNSAACVVAQLTQLTSLEWHNAVFFTALGWEQLTVLRGLQRLAIGGYGLECVEIDCARDKVSVGGSYWCCFRISAADVIRLAPLPPLVTGQSSPQQPACRLSASLLLNS